MRKLPKLGLWAAVSSALLVFGFFTATMPTVEARPQYKKAFGEKYGDKIKKVDCKICHPKGTAEGAAKTRNDYAKAFGKALAKKNEKNAEKINDALDAAAKEKSKIEGKTYGDLIEEGKPPGSTE